MFNLYPLSLTFAFSLLLHLCCIFFFEIKVWLPLDFSSISTPTTIAFDIDVMQMDDMHGPFPLITDKALQLPSVEEEISLLQMKGVRIPAASLYALSQFPLLVHALSTPDKDETSYEPFPEERRHEELPRLPSFLPWETDPQEMASNQVIRIFPIKLSLFHGVQALDIIDDASSLFTAANESTVSLTTSFAPIKPTVEFFIRVDPETGKIAEWSCVKELVDKRLQSLALRIVKTIRFRVPNNVEKKSLSGALSLQFNGNFETIAQRVAWDTVR